MTDSISKNILHDGCRSKCGEAGIPADIRSIKPDSLTGMIFAMEGMQHTIVLLNGPMGCKFYHSTTSQFLTIRPLLYLPSTEEGKKVPVDYNYLNDWFFRQPRVPCTYLDGYDYVYGTGEKVRQALRFLRDNVDFDMIAIVNSPGASLIGDNLKEIAGQEIPDCRTVMLESPGYSEDFSSGYGRAVLEMLRQVGLPMWQRAGHVVNQGAGQIMQSGAGPAVQSGAGQDTEPEKGPAAEPGKGPAVEPQSEGQHAAGKADGFRHVNILGLSLWQLYQEGDREELERILGMCGIKVNSFLCAGSSLEELEKLPEADLNIVLYEENDGGCAAWLRDTCGTPYHICRKLPVGFDETEHFIQDICQTLGGDFDLASFREEMERARALAWYKVNEIYQMCGLPKGVSFAVCGTADQEDAYTTFLKEYLGMTPVGPGQAELVFSDANVISELMTKRSGFCGIQISLPGMGYVDIIRKTHLGIRGALFLIEQVLNGLMSKL